MKPEDVKVGMKVKLVGYYSDHDQLAFEKGSLILGGTYVVNGFNDSWDYGVKLEGSNWRVSLNMIEPVEESPKQFLNESLIPFKDLTDEQKLLIIRDKIKGNAQLYYRGVWEDAVNHEVAFSSVYRTKPIVEAPKETPLDIPWQFIKPEYKWAAMDNGGFILVYEEKPEVNVKTECWEINLGGSCKHVGALNIPTEGIIWYKSLTKRPDWE